MREKTRATVTLSYERQIGEREKEKKQSCCSKWERGNAVGGGARELTIMC